VGDTLVKVQHKWGNFLAIEAEMMVQFPFRFMLEYTLKKIDRVVGCFVWPAAKCLLDAPREPCWIGAGAPVRCM
jgi:hypothetical protein